MQFINGKYKSNISLRILYISYLSLLLLWMPTKNIGIVFALVLGIVGLIGFFILYKKEYKCSASVSSFMLGIIVLTNSGIYFFNRWFPSSKVERIASLFRIPKTEFLNIVSCILVLSGSILGAYIIQIICAEIKCKDNQQSLRSNVISLFISALVLTSLPQIMINEDVLSMGYFRFFCGVFIVFSLELFFYCLTTSIGFSFILISGIIMILSTVNVYIFQFRDRLLDPIDLLSFNTALNVVDNYSFFPIPNRVVIGWVLYLVISIYLFYSCFNKCSLKGKKRVFLAIVSIIGSFAIIMYTNTIKTRHWQKEGVKYNGYILNFLSAFKEAYISKPNGYNTDDIEMLVEKYPLDVNLNTDEKKPNIIVIMDESFSDLTVNGDFETDNAVVPFISSLKENTISGYVLASVYGGNTANSEYEFLTGNTMAWLSPNVVPYQQYVKESSYSMVSYLKEYFDYRCIALHPYLSDGWNRPNTYSNLNFDEIYFLDDFPQQNLIRNYVSDQEMFEKIIDIYETNQQEPLFVFGVSMQNHGDYLYSGDNFDYSISLSGYNTSYKDVDQYLSLIHETDSAVESLIEYFQNVDHETVIVFFGDHQPILCDDFYDVVLQSNVESLNDLQNRYTVPFFIYANYDIDEQDGIFTSLNYLANYVYKVSDITLPPYNQFLTEMENMIPSININGFYSKEKQQYLSFEEASETEKNWLETYKKLQYNNIADVKNHNNSIFPVSAKQ